MFYSIVIASIDNYVCGHNVPRAHGGGPYHDQHIRFHTSYQAVNHHIISRYIQFHIRLKFHIGYIITYYSDKHNIAMVWTSGRYM